MYLRKTNLKWKLKLGQIKFIFSSDCDEKVFVPVGQSNSTYVDVSYLCMCPACM